MARCYCRWRRVLVCLCTPCVCMTLPLIYVTVMMCTTMTKTSTPGVVHLNTPPPPHFVASGAFRNKSFSSFPKSFWQLNPHGDAFWNRLQLSIDRHFNPILRPKTNKGRFEPRSLLRKSLSEVMNMNNKWRNLVELPLQIQEFVRSMQRREYPNILQPGGTCGAGAKEEKEPPLLLLAIKTTEPNFKNREAIRQSWGKVGWVAGPKRNSSQNSGGFIRRVFLLGKHDSTELDVDLSEFVKMESERYGDILQWDFKDTFFNLTLKDVHFWSWFSSSCSQVRFVFKGDDDVFVNTPKLVGYLLDQLEKPESMNDFMIGDVIGAAVPNRVNDSKYFIPDSFYKGLYPSYAGGGGVVYSGLLTKRLHMMSKRVHLFPIDDVFVGMCMIRLNAQPVHHPAFLTFDFSKKEEEEPCSYHTILLVHKRTPEQVVRLWDELNKTQTQCSHVDLRVQK